jgi:hypothetical protein
MRNSDSGRYTVAFFELFQECGGCEEGGWYYTSGTPVDHLSHYTRTFKSKRAAMNYQDYLDSLAKSFCDNTSPLWSVNYSGGKYSAKMQRNTQTPYDFPRNRPYYC